MANYSFTHLYRTVPGQTTINTLTPESSPSQHTTLVIGDTLTFTNSASSNQNIVFYYKAGHEGLYFSPNKTMPQTLVPGESIVLTATSAVSSTYVYGDPPLVSYEGNKLVFITIVASLDDTPSSWSFPTRNSARPGSYVYETKTISGINTSINVSVTGGQVREPYSTGWQNSVTVNNGDTVELKVLAPPDYNQTYGYTVNGGSASTTWYIGTGSAPDPNTGVKIYSGLSLPVELSEVGDFFGRRSSSATHLRDYLRGGGYVPNISENNGVPTSGNLYLSDLAGTYTSLYFKIPPADHYDFVDTTGGGKTMGMTCNFVSDYLMGFSDTLGYEAQYYISFSISGGTNIGGSSISYNVPIPNAWSSANRDFNIVVTADANSEGRYLGDVTISARHPASAGQSVSATFKVFFNFYGP